MRQFLWLFNGIFNILAQDEADSLFRLASSRYDGPLVTLQHLQPILDVRSIIAYVKNKDSEFGDKPHEVSGMLLYAQTDEAVQPDNTYMMSGNRISVKTLDLNCEFSEISAQLNAIADCFLAGHKTDGGPRR